MVLVGRNDDYLGDFKYRITTGINLLANNAARINRLKQLEIIVVDWNSPTTPLSQILPLSQQACEITKFIEVPPSLAEKFHEPKETFNGVLAANSGIRRAQGEFIMFMPADILVPQSSLSNLLQLLSGSLKTCFDPTKSHFNIPRRLVPWQVTEKKFTPTQWERYFELGPQLKSDSDSYPGLSACMGAILMHHSLWHECQGFFEVLHGWGWSDVELGLRINQQYPSINLNSFGIEVFDLQKRPQVEETKSKQNAPHCICGPITPNSADWGLKKYELKESKATSYTEKAPCKKIIQQIKLNQLGQKSFAEIRTIIPQGQLILTPCEKTGLPLLLECAQKLIPHTYLDIGASRGYSLALAGHFNPGGEFYGLDDWQPEPFFQEKCSPAITSLWTKQVNFQGYLRFISGPKENALDRLEQDHLAQGIKFDLIYFRLDFFANQAKKQVTKVLSLLQPGGVIIFVSNSPERLFQTEDLLQQSRFVGQWRIFNNQALVFTILNQQQIATRERDKKKSQDLTAQGETLIAQGKTSEGFGCFLKAIELDPDNPLAHNNLGVLYSKGNVKKALQHLTLASKLNPTDKAIRENLERIRRIIPKEPRSSIIPTPKQLRPAARFPTYPPYHQGPYLEEYFYLFFQQQQIELAYKYLPIFWTNCYNNGLPRAFIQNFLDTLDPHDSYFTVCQHDDAPAERLPPHTLIFSAGGNAKGREIIPIPLICSQIPQPENYVQGGKKFLASFVGSVTHPIRQKMVQVLENKPGYHLECKPWTSELSADQAENFLKITGQSRFTLCPRGYGPTSFRLYEAMQLDSVPVYISDRFYLPWTDDLNWREVALLVSEEDLPDLDRIISQVSEEQYQTMLNNCKKLYPSYFSLQGTCEQIISTLKRLKSKTK